MTREHVFERQEVADAAMQYASLARDAGDACALVEAAAMALTFVIFGEGPAVQGSLGMLAASVARVAVGLDFPRADVLAMVGAAFDQVATDHAERTARKRAADEARCS